MKIRLLQQQDIPGIKLILEETQLFPSDMLEDMVSGFFDETGPEALWLTCEDEGAAIGFCYSVPEQMTDGTWNMLAVAVLPSRQGQRIGGAIVRALEEMLREKGNRILIVDTSGVEEFAQTREFYRKNGYAEEARIRDFWALGDDKVTFWKAL